MRSSGYIFRPGRAAILVTLLVFPLLAGLGVWQLERASEKQMLQEKFTQHAADEQIVITAGMEFNSNLQYRSAHVVGEYDIKRQFLWDNQIHHGRAGYHVLSPLRLAQGDVGILVNRGWVPLGLSRENLPDLPVPAGERKLQGLIKSPSGAPFYIGALQVPEAGWPKRIQQVDFQELSEILGYDLMPMTLLLSQESEDGFMRDWKPVYIGSDRHLGYAFQWFSMAFAVLVIFFAVNWKKVEYE